MICTIDTPSLIVSTGTSRRTRKTRPPSTAAPAIAATIAPTDAVGVAGHGSHLPNCMKKPSTHTLHATWP
jgi:hypothetical protein